MGYHRKAEGALLSSSGEVKGGRTPHGQAGEVSVGQHRLPRCQGDWLGNSVLGAEWFSGHQCPEGLWVLLLLPSLEVSGTLDAQGSADAGDHGNVGGHSWFSCLPIPQGPLGLVSGSSPRLVDCFCLSPLRECSH